jgi:hypothetical protein
MSKGRPTKEELENQIGRYRTLSWAAEDDLTRDALRATIKLLQHELEAREQEEIEQAQPRPAASDA